ncbi:hypothetical protein, partial [Bifidobacterium pseudolongum]|uniref:hypothetical protein n=1 Tax=Bifidobacterium pseudolongum TaxID=1694 RepID=UPI001A9310E2
MSELTVHKYLRMRDLSPRPQARWSRPSKINPWVPLIEQWLAGKPYYSKDVFCFNVFSAGSSVFFRSV